MTNDNNLPQPCLVESEIHLRSPVFNHLEGTVRQAGIAKCNIFLFDDNSEGDTFWMSIGFTNRDDLKLMQRET